MPIDREVQDRRRKAILEILTENPVKNQNDIRRALRKMGFKTTQSSISRDLKTLGIVRRHGFYNPPAERGDESVLGKLEEYIRQVGTAGPYMLVFETNPGTAKAVAMALKKTEWPEVKGILAEDDTIFMVTNNVYDTRLLTQRLKRIITK